MATRSPEQPDIEIARRIRAKRIELGVTQAELASHLNMAAQNVQKYEAGRQRVSAAILAEIANFLATPVSWFFDAVSGQEIVVEVETDEGSNQAMRVLRAMRSLPAPVRRDFVRLIETLARQEDDRH